MSETGIVDLSSGSQTALAFPALSDLRIFPLGCKMSLFANRSPIFAQSFNAFFLLQIFSFSTSCLCILIEKACTTN